MTDARPERPRFRLTTRVLMVWVFTAGLAMGLLRGDAATWVSSETSTVLVLALVMLAAVLSIPLLGELAERSPDPNVRRPFSAGEQQVEHLLTVGCLGLVIASLLVLGALLVAIARAG